MMWNRSRLENELAQRHGELILRRENQGEKRLFFDVPHEAVRDVSRTLLDGGGRYQVSIGWDQIEGDGTLGLAHTFAFDREGLLVKLRTAVSAADPVVESLALEIPSAGWSERELMDLLGIRFREHPKPKRLVLSDDFPDGVYPLRKEVPWNLMPPAAEDVAYQLDECPDGLSVVPVGPFHPTLHEPAHFAVYVDGETVKGCDYRGFMTHRGIEKLCQTQVNYSEIPYVAERICGICGSVHATAYAQAVELAGGIQISRRAEYIRTLMLELERIHSHLLWLGVAGHLIGFDTVFMQAWRVREPVMWLSERITGNRKTYGMVVVGGVRRDITPEVAGDIRNVLQKVEEETGRIDRAIRKDTGLHRRTRGVGRISREQTVDWSLVGPVARARGVDIDARRDHPYAAYGDLDFEVPVRDDCDVWATLQVRIVELYEAIKIIRQVLDWMPEDGPLQAGVDEEIPPGRHAISVVEAPRGESVHYVITGEGNRPERWRVRAPTYPNLQGVPMMMLDNELADVPIIIGSIDPCFSCTDRVNVVDIRSGNVLVVKKREIDRLCRNKETRR